MPDLGADQVELLEVEAEYSAARDKVLIDLKYREGDRVLGVIWALDWDAAHEHLCTLADAVATGADARDR